MAKIIYNCEDVRLTHERVVELRGAGDLNLGINDDFAARLAQEKGLGPKKTTANAAFHFWNIAAVSGFAYTLYLSFTSAWWWGFLGFFGCIWFYRINKKSNSENYLDAAMLDKDFYERVQDLNGWIYQIEEDVFAEKLREEERTKKGAE